MITWSCQIKWNIRSVMSLLQKILWPPNLARWWLSMRSFLAQCYSILWTCGHVRPREIKNIISTTTMRMATKPCRVATFTKELLSIKSKNPLINWYCKVMWQMKYVKYLLAHSLVIKLDRVVSYCESLPPITSRE